jgi:hypothetical protein
MGIQRIYGIQEILRESREYDGNPGNLGNTKSAVSTLSPALTSTSPAGDAASPAGDVVASPKCGICDTAGKCKKNLSPQIFVFLSDFV